MPTPAPIPGPAGSAGATGPAGPAPSGTGLVSVTSGVLDTPSTLATRLAADPTGNRSAIGAGTSNYATPTTTRGDMIRRGASADERVALGATGYVLTSDGTDPVWAAATGGAETDTPQLTDLTGWTVTPMLLGSGTVTGGAYTSTIPAGIVALTGSFVSRAWPFADAMSWEIQARVEITADTAGELLAGLKVEWTAGGYAIYLRGNGGLYFYRDGSWGFASQTADGSSLPRDGTLWLRIRGTGTLFQAWRGIGSGSTPPAAWTCVSQFTDASVLGSRSAPNNLVMMGFSNDMHLVPSGTTVVWRDVRVRSFSP